MTEIRLIDSSEDNTWDQHVLSHDFSGPYLLTAWKNAVESAYGHDTFYLAACSGNEITGVLPLVKVKPPLTNGVLVSLPFCDYGGILADGRDTEKALLQRAVELADKLKTALEIRTPARCPAIEENKKFIQVTDKCRMLLELPGNSTVLWSGLKSKLRSQIKKPLKEGLTARLGSREMTGDFYRVFSRNMRDLGSPVHSRRWIETVVDTFGENACIGVVYRDSQPVGAGIILLHEKNITIPWASTLKEFNRFSPNMLLYWTFLEFAADNGGRLFDFGRSTPGEGTYAFKKQWGALPAPLFWYRYNSRGLPLKNHSSENGRLRSALEGAWQRLPLQAANALGPRVRKYIDK